MLQFYRVMYHAKTGSKENCKKVLIAHGTVPCVFIEYAVKRVGSKKILFGTDTYAFGFSFGRIAFSPLSLEDKENILWKNAVNLFPKAFK